MDIYTQGKQIAGENHENGDHEFAAWLRARDWQKDRNGRIGNATTFRNSKGENIAIAFYNNRRSTYRAFELTKESTAD